MTDTLNTVYRSSRETSWYSPSLCCTSETAQRPFHGETRESGLATLAWSIRWGKGDVVVKPDS
ncbi:hypothetical protein C8Q80DRAFT_1211038 [Daedaleopsis nitida]|nr:hypothetical protein C8Q80DRAFT_1211038 [Daedaleopsis nitida]